MKSSIFNRLVRSILKPAEKSLLTQWQEQLLPALLIVALLTTLLVCVGEILVGRQTGNQVALALAIAAGLWLFLMRLMPRFSYSLKSTSLIIVVYLLGLIGLRESLAYGGIFLLAFPCVTAVLRSSKIGWAALAAGLASFLFAVAWTNNVSWGSFLIWGMAYASAGGMLLFVIGSMLRSLEASSQQNQVLAEKIERERAAIEQVIQNKEHETERRVLQVRTAAEISRAISAELDPSRLLQQVVDLIKERFGLYYAGVFLKEEEQDYAVLYAGTGEPGQQMVAGGHQLQVGGESMIGWAIQNRKPRIALDVGVEAVRFNNPFLPLTRSEMALPLLSGERVLGALTIQSSQSMAFDRDDIAILQGIADSLAITLDHARLFQQVQENLAEIQALNRQYLVEAWREASTKSRLQNSVYIRQSSQHEPSSAGTLELPLTLREQPLGRLVLDGIDPNLPPDEQSFVEAIMTQAAMSLENVRLLESTQKKAYDERMVAEIVRLAGAENGMGAILHTMLMEVGRWTKIQQGCLVFRSLEFTYTSAGYEVRMIFPQPDNWATFTQVRTDDLDNGWLLQAPIILHGQTEGCLSLFRSNGQTSWTKEEVGLVVKVVNQVTPAIENALLLEELQLRVQREQLVGQLSSRIQTSLDLDTLLRTAVRELGQIASTSEVSIHFLPPEKAGERG